VEKAQSFLEFAGTNFKSTGKDIQIYDKFEKLNEDYQKVFDQKTHESKNFKSIY
jgi:hypothetical protein